MSGISTHVLDTSSGKAAAGVPVTLARESDGVWTALAEAVTDADGRCKELFGAEGVFAGRYRLNFDVAAYFGERASLYPEVTITFQVPVDGASYHIPLLLSPFGYSTYRGT